MAAQQTRAYLAEKKRKLDLACIKDIWQSCMSIKYENVKKIMPVAVDVVP